MWLSLGCWYRMELIQMWWISMGRLPPIMRWSQGILRWLSTWSPLKSTWAQSTSVKRPSATGRVKTPAAKSSNSWPQTVPRNSPTALREKSKKRKKLLQCLDRNNPLQKWMRKSRQSGMSWPYWMKKDTMSLSLWSNSRSFRLSSQISPSISMARKTRKKKATG